jgi:hypothetical protein
MMNMIKINSRSGKACTGLAILLVLAAGLVLVASASDAARRERVVPKYLVLFPLDAPSADDSEKPGATPVPETYGTDIMGEFRKMLSRIQGYRPVLFSDKLAPVMRARQDGTLKLDDIQPPYSESNGRALTLAKLLLTDLYMVGTIEDYKVDAAANEAMVTLSVRLCDGRNGKQLKSFVVTGRANQSNVDNLNMDLDVLAGLDALGALRDQMLEKPAAGK